LSALVDELRPFWLRGIHGVTGRPERGLLGLLAQQRYQVYAPATRTSVTLSFADWDQVPAAFATDAARFSMAAFESAEGIMMSQSLPKSTAWLLIRSYYAAFFAVHALGGMLGQALTQLDAAAVGAVDTVVGAYGMQGAGGIHRGFYRCLADGVAGTLRLVRVPSGGSHEVLWNEFITLLRRVTTGILSQPNGTATSQQAAARLTEVEMALTSAGTVAKGTWLSIVRNRVNYHHEFGSWFPYSERGKYCDALLSRARKWSSEPDALTVRASPGRDLEQFVDACAVIVALCRATCLDMAERCPSGGSFLDLTSARLLRQLQAA